MMEYWAEYLDPLLQYSNTPSPQIFCHVGNA
jgi:hypothetical protein